MRMGKKVDWRIGGLVACAAVACIAAAVIVACVIEEAVGWERDYGGPT
jgi:hypothetical protein